jgi:hypothetical protein
MFDVQGRYCWVNTGQAGSTISQLSIVQNSAMLRHNKLDRFSTAIIFFIVA